MDQHLIEQLSLQAWPSLKDEEFDGWIMRFSNGYTKRANSVYPLAISTLPLSIKVTHCESKYRDEQLPCIFKIPEGNEWVAIDHYLEGQGYTKVDESFVMVMDLTEFTPSIRENLSIEMVDSSQWLTYFYQFQHGPNDPNRIFERMIAMKEWGLHFGLMRQADDVLACALIASPPKWKEKLKWNFSGTQHFYGLFDVVVRADLRGNGYGRWLMNGIMNWCKQQGGTKVYLQVLKKNEPARKLYESFGFLEIYRYWYRIKEFVKKGEDHASMVK